MPTYLLRATPDEAFYVAWSTVVEAPVWCGDEGDVYGYLARESRCPEACCHAKQVTDRLHRARTTGTSSLDGFYAFDDGELIAEQRGLLPRECVGAYAREYDEGKGDDNPAFVYLQPFEDVEAGAA